MDLTQLKNKKPFLCPKWLWNAAVGVAFDTAKENLKVDRIARFIGDAALDGLQKSIDGKDPKTIATVCTTVANGGQVFVKAADAAKDGTITQEEKTEVGNALTATVVALVSQDRIDEKIGEIKGALTFG